MKIENTNHKFQRIAIPFIAILAIALNIFDIVAHVRADMAEPLRITGNVVAIAAALIVLLGVAKVVAPQILGGSAVAVFILNTFHSFQHGFGPPMLVFVGATLFMLLRLGQMQSMEAVLQSGNSGTESYHRWWAALLISLVGVAIVVVAG